MDKNLIFGKGLIDAYITQENYAIYPRIILSDNQVAGREISVDGQESLPKDEDEYYYINTLERYIDCESLQELEENSRYQKMKACIDTELSGFADRRVREKYLWLRKELRRIRRNLELKEGKLIYP